MASLKFDGSVAGEIKRHPEVETLLVTRDNRSGAVNKRRLITFVKIPNMATTEAKDEPLEKIMIESAFSQGGET